MVALVTMENSNYLIISCSYSLNISKQSKGFYLLKLLLQLIFYQRKRTKTSKLHQRDRLWVRFPLEDGKKITFSFSRSGNEAKRGFKFRHSTRNDSRIWWIVGNGSVLMGVS